jgi:hypothetical protein
MTSTTESKTAAGLHPDGRDDHNIPAGDLMNTTKATRRDAHTAMRTICAHLKIASRAQGLTFGALRKKTGLNPREVLKVWLGLNPTPQTVEHCRTALGLSIDQVWGAR